MSELNPILNNPYEEPLFYYSTDLDGRLDYDNKRKGRRPFVPILAAIPVGQKGERSLSNKVIKLERTG